MPSMSIASLLWPAPELRGWCAGGGACVMRSMCGRCIRQRTYATLLRPGTRGGEGSSKVAQDLLRLCADVADPYDAALGIDGVLATDADLPGKREADHPGAVAGFLSDDDVSVRARSCSRRRMTRPDSSDCFRESRRV